MKHDAFFSHSHLYKSIVREIAEYMEDEYDLNIWLDSWKLIAGEKWIQEIESGLDNSKSCIVFWGEHNSTGWFQDEVELALNIQSKRRNYRVVPVLLPNSSNLPESKFLSLRTAIDLRENIKDEEELYRLYCAIIGKIPGRFKKAQTDVEQKLENLKKLHNKNLIEKEVLIQLQIDIVKNNGMV